MMRIDMGNVTLEADRIVEKSYRIVRQYVPGDTDEDFILKRSVIALGDPQIKDIIVFRNDAVERGIEAVLANARIVTDIRMVKVGISGEMETYTAVEHSEGAKERGITRASMGMLNLRDKLDGAIVSIGNAPSAAITLCELIEDGVRPAVVVGTPVGFVNAAESKEMIRELDVPSITCVGTRGGSTLCVAIVNGLINLARSRQTR